MPDWLPACVACGAVAVGFPTFEGPETGPASARHLAGPWACHACGTRNCLSRARWVPEERARAPILPWTPPAWVPHLAEAPEHGDWELLRGKTAASRDHHLSPR